MADRPAGTGLPLFALTVLTGGLAIGAAILAFPPTGQPSLPGLYPQPIPEVGADLREAVVGPLGAGAWVFVCGWLAVGVSLLRRRPLTSLARVLCGFMLTGCGCLLAEWVGPEHLPGRLAGSGGSVGAFTAVWLDDHFQRTG